MENLILSNFLVKNQSVQIVDFKAQGIGVDLLGNQLSALYSELTVSFHEGILQELLQQLNLHVPEESSFLPHDFEGIHKLEKHGKS